jgi:toxin ParE1/3/4
MFPYSGRQGSVEGTYELVVSRLPYIAVYRVTDSVEIVAVFHAAQDRDGEKAE